MSARRGDWIGDEPEGRRVPAHASSSSLEEEAMALRCDDEADEWPSSESEPAATGAVVSASRSSRAREDDREGGSYDRGCDGYCRGRSIGGVCMPNADEGGGLTCEGVGAELTLERGVD